jgi:hypothetical protein
VFTTVSIHPKALPCGILALRQSGELYPLEVKDIDFIRGIVHIWHSMWEGRMQSPKSRNAYRAIEVQSSLNRCEPQR